jgi:HAMP domain-containing protein
MSGLSESSGWRTAHTGARGGGLNTGTRGKRLLDLAAQPSPKRTDRIPAFGARRRGDPEDEEDERDDEGANFDGEPDGYQLDWERRRDEDLAEEEGGDQDDWKARNKRRQFALTAISEKSKYNPEFPRRPSIVPIVDPRTHPFTESARFVSLCRSIANRSGKSTDGEFYRYPAADERRCWHRDFAIAWLNSFQPFKEARNFGTLFEPGFVGSMDEVLDLLQEKPQHQRKSEENSPTNQQEKDFWAALLHSGNLSAASIFKLLLDMELKHGKQAMAPLLRVLGLRAPKDGPPSALTHSPAWALFQDYARSGHEGASNALRRLVQEANAHYEAAKTSLTVTRDELVKARQELENRLESTLKKASTQIIAMVQAIDKAFGDDLEFAADFPVDELESGAHLEDAASKLRSARQKLDAMRLSHLSSASTHMDRAVAKIQNDANMSNTKSACASVFVARRECKDAVDFLESAASCLEKASERGWGAAALWDPTPRMDWEEKPLVFGARARSAHTPRSGAKDCTFARSVRFGPDVGTSYPADLEAEDALLDRIAAEAERWYVNYFVEHVVMPFLRSPLQRSFADVNDYYNISSSARAGQDPGRMFLDWDFENFWAYVYEDRPAYEDLLCPLLIFQDDRLDSCDHGQRRVPRSTFAASPACVEFEKAARALVTAAVCKGREAYVNNLFETTRKDLTPPAHLEEKTMPVFAKLVALTMSINMMDNPRVTVLQGRDRRRDAAQREREALVYEYHELRADRSKKLHAPWPCTREPPSSDDATWDAPWPGAAPRAISSAAARPRPRGWSASRW